LNSYGIRDVCNKTESPMAFVRNQLSGLLQRRESACDERDIRAGTGGLYSNGTPHPRTCAGNQHDPVRKVHYGFPSSYGTSSPSWRAAGRRILMRSFDPQRGTFSAMKNHAGNVPGHG
jgi:hypothetical protein